MRLGLRAKETFAVTVLVVIAVGITSLIHLGHLTRVVVESATGQADLIARQVYTQAGRALVNKPGAMPADVLVRDRELRGLLEASIAYSPQVLDVAVVDPGGHVIVHSQPDQAGTLARMRPALPSLLALDPVRRIWTLYWRNGSYDVILPLMLDGRPFGSARVGVSSSLLRRELGIAIWDSAVLTAFALPVAWLIAMGLANLVLRPLRALVGEMDRLQRGESTVAPDVAGPGEIGQLASRLQRLGRELHSDRQRVIHEKSELQRLVDRLEDGIVLLDDDGRVLFANKTAELAIGQPLDAVAGRNLVAVLEPAHPLRSLLEQPVGGRRTGPRNAQIELPLEDRWKEFLVSILFVNDAGPSQASVVVLRDLESVKTVQSLISYSAKLAALGSLTSGLAHEVKNPLNAMMLHLALLKERLPTAAPEVLASLDVVGNEIRRLDRVVQGFLSFARPQELKPKPLDVNALATSVASLVEPECQAQGIRFTLDLDRTIPDVIGDDDLLRQALLNVVRNAAQAMPSGGVVTIATSHDRDAVRVRITDEGVGIPAEDVEKIFGLYYTSKPDGNGVGLAVVYRIIQMHDGRIDVASEVGRGTTMTITLPKR
jgi:signal transduction histidine kinase/HAMP domain-containing protein